MQSFNKKIYASYFEVTINNSGERTTHNGSFSLEINMIKVSQRKKYPNLDIESKFENGFFFFWKISSENFALSPMLEGLKRAY